MKSWSIAASALFCSACVLGPEPKLARLVAEGNYCAAREALDLAAPDRATEDVDVAAPHAVGRGYSARALEVARAIGAVGQVEGLAEALDRHADAAEIAVRRGQVNDAIEVAALDLASTVAHLACEEGRAEQIAADLRSAEQAQTRHLTAYSLVVGAATSIAGGALAIAYKDQTPAAAVGIAGGVASGSFGFATLAVHRTTTFRHTRNILGEVWRGQAHPSFPEIIWAYLTRRQFSRTKEGTLREYLVASWKQSGRIGEDGTHPDAAKVARYFGDGGSYDAAGLDDRASMLSDVREVTSLLNHGLQHLAMEAARR